MRSITNKGDSEGVILPVEPANPFRRYIHPQSSFTEAAPTFQTQVSPTQLTSGLNESSRALRKTDAVSSQGAGSTAYLTRPAIGLETQNPSNPSDRISGRDRRMEVSLSAIFTLKVPLVLR